VSYYTLDERNQPVRVDLERWISWRPEFKNRRIVARDHVDGRVVSTVFLGLDHRFGDGPPVLWETMVFAGDPETGEITDFASTEDGERYTSHADALAGHARWCEIVRGGKPEPQS
jgi:hypothetical protein